MILLRVQKTSDSLDLSSFLMLMLGFMMLFTGCDSGFKSLSNEDFSLGSGKSGGEIRVASAKTVPKMIGEVISNSGQIHSEEFPTTLSVFLHAKDAAKVAASGRSVFLPLEDFFTVDANKNKVIRKNASEVLTKLISKYPIFNEPGIRVLVLDEVFWTGDGVGNLGLQFAEAMKAIDIVRGQLPLAKLAMNFTPASFLVLKEGSAQYEKEILYAKKLLARLDVFAIDPYTFDMQKEGPLSLENLVSFAKNASVFAREANPSIERWIVLQGFADPAWNLEDFASFLRKLMMIANEKYEGTIIFGWQLQHNNTPGYELPDSWAGMHFPSWLKKVYFDFATQSCDEREQTAFKCSDYAGQYGIPAGYSVGKANWTKNSCTNAITYTGGCSAP